MTNDVHQENNRLEMKSEKIRVLFITAQSTTFVSGGVRTQMEKTAEYLSKFGVHVSFFDQWHSQPFKNIDLVHIFGANVMTWEISKRLQEFGIPYVVSPIFFTLRSPWQMRLTEKIEQIANTIISGIRTDYGFLGQICRGAALSLPNTSDESKLIISGCGVDPESVIVIPNGVENRFASAQPEIFEKEFGIRDFVLNVGHIGSPRKNVLRLVESFQDIDKQLVIIGKIHKNSYSDRILETAKRNSRVLIIPGLRHESELLASAFSCSSIFTLPSLFETPGIAALEAVLAGAKISITKFGGTKDYFQEDAFYCNPYSHKSIIESIYSADGASFSERLRERIMRDFTWEKVAEKTAACYYNVIRKKK